MTDTSANCAIVLFSKSISVLIKDGIRYNFMGKGTKISMIALKILEIKNFMARLFQKNDFDDFLVSEAEVQTAAGYKINGHRNHSFYSEEELKGLKEPDFLSWTELKPLVFQMIRGSKTPQLLSVVFRLTDDTVEQLLADSGAKISRKEISGAYVNLRYQAGELMIVTGTSFCTFVLDKAFEQRLDSYAKEFLREKEIAAEEL